MSVDNLSSEAIKGVLETRIIGREVLYFPSLPSTMTEAAEQARAGAAEGMVVIAEEQTAGKGRLKRGWLTPAGNIALSVILRPSASLLPSVIMIASVAVARSIEAVTGLETQIKWPNDVLIRGKKVCGILIENGFKGDAVSHSIVGIGIDVALNPADYPEIRDIATSLSAELGRPVSRLSVIRKLLEEMEGLYLLAASGPEVYQEWRDRMVTLGKRVKVMDIDAVHEGTAESVEADGSLMLRQENGELLRIITGDVTLRL